MTKVITKKEKGQNRHWKNFVDKDYLGSHNLEKGEELLVTIERFEGEEQVFNKESNQKLPKMVLYFKENVPKMIMNITNGNTLTTLYGAHPENWAGKRIQIFSTKVKGLGGKEQDGLRIRDVVPKGKIDNRIALEKILGSTSLENLREVYQGLTVEERNDADVIKVKDKLKADYENTPKS